MAYSSGLRCSHQLRTSCGRRPVCLLGAGTGHLHLSRPCALTLSLFLLSRLPKHFLRRRQHQLVRRHHGASLHVQQAALLRCRRSLLDLCGKHPLLLLRRTLTLLAESRVRTLPPSLASSSLNSKLIPAPAPAPTETGARLGCTMGDFSLAASSSGRRARVQLAPRDLVRRKSGLLSGPASDPSL